MGNKKKYFKLKAISLAQQATQIENTYTTFNCKFTSKGKLIVIGTIRPSPLSRIYTIKISYVIGKSPVIEVINPKFDSELKKLPHVYEGNTLCLFYPRNKEWTKYDYIANKIIPWTSMWLYYYEVWKITGEWQGGGKHPNIDNRRKSLDRYIN